jgi:acetylornithine deacetylase/succinyl-diaminopimelate desuccinylase-like protein
MDLSRALALAADGRDRALADLIELARIPSVSADPAYAGDVVRAANWLAERLRA